MINIFSLYKNVVPRCHIPGIKSNLRLDDQTSGYWLPYLNKNGDVYLVDTYHINFYGNTQKFIDDFLTQKYNNHDSSYLIRRANSEYYYSGSVKITDNIEKYFEEVCDLRNVELCNNPSDYNPEDIFLNVQLWFEHAYPHGVNFKKKNASINKNRQALNHIGKLIGNINYSYIYDNDLKTLDSYLNVVDEITKKKILITKKFLEEQKKYSELVKKSLLEYRNSIEELDNKVTKKVK